MSSGLVLLQGKEQENIGNFKNVSGVCGEVSSPLQQVFSGVSRRQNV